MSILLGGPKVSPETVRQIVDSPLETSTISAPEKEIELARAGQPSPFSDVNVASQNNTISRLPGPALTKLHAEVNHFAQALKAGDLTPEYNEFQASWKTFKQAVKGATVSVEQNIISANESLQNVLQKAEQIVSELKRREVNFDGCITASLPELMADVANYISSRRR